MVLPIYTLAICLTLTQACSSDSENSPETDASARADSGSLPDATGDTQDAGGNQSDAMPLGPDADVSMLCAQPGAVGNNQGVGQYCQTNGDCGGAAASLCTVVQRPEAPPFCTKVCFGIGDECGDNATCDGDGVLMGCVPNCILEE